MKIPALILALTLWPAGIFAADVDIYTSKDLQTLGKQAPTTGAEYADHALARYGNHYLLYVRRDATGSSELHAHEADVFVVESGSGVLVTGGKLVGAHTTKPGEMRGSSIEGGTRHSVSAGDVIHIPAGTPHQLLVKTEPFTYFVVKVTDQQTGK